MFKPTAAAIAEATDPIILYPLSDGLIVYSIKSQRQFLVHRHSFYLLCKDGVRIWLADNPSDATWIANADLIDMVARFDKRFDNSAARIEAAGFIKQWKNAHGGHLIDKAIEPTKMATAADEPGEPVSAEDTVIDPNVPEWRRETYTACYNPMANWARVHDL